MSQISIDQTILPHHKELCFSGALCDLSTNSNDLMNVLEGISIWPNGGGECRFSVRVFVDEASAEELGDPHFRGLHHVVIASFGEANVFVFDVLRRSISARVSFRVASDCAFWREKLIPIALGVLGAAMGMVPMHCACLEMDGDGLLIAGASGAGKSTLSVALSQEGFNYVSDDWTYISQRDFRIAAHGTTAPVKLLPDAALLFSELDSHSVHVSMNGELAYEVDIKTTFGGQVKRFCEPRRLIFLERMQRPGSEFTRLSSEKTRSYLNSTVERLPEQLREAQQKREQTIEIISSLPCWNFRYGGTPQFAAEELYNFVTRHSQEVLA